MGSNPTLSMDICPCFFCVCVVCVGCGLATDSSAVQGVLSTVWTKKLTKLNSVAVVRKRTIPTERPQLVGEISANLWRKRVLCGQRNEFPRLLISVLVPQTRGPHYRFLSFTLISKNLNVKVYKTRTLSTDAEEREAYTLLWRRYRLRMCAEQSTLS
jgi:hypothetical protein